MIYLDYNVFMGFDIQEISMQTTGVLVLSWQVSSRVGTTGQESVGRRRNGREKIVLIWLSCDVQWCSPCSHASTGNSIDKILTPNICAYDVRMIDLNYE